jgi:pyruvate dehydrogenase E2 component (dihydrolipoamide acetyltransferase)
MPIPITVPRLGWNMEQGVFVGWLKTDGSIVRAGESLFTLEGEKATEDVECLDSGLLHIPIDGPKAGATVNVGAVIGYLLQPSEAVPSPSFRPPDTQISLGPPTISPSPSRPETTAPKPLGVAISPRARRAATRLDVDATKAIGTGRNGRIRERDVLAMAPPVSRTRRAIAERMLTSHRSTAPVTLTTTVDATNLVQLRNQLKLQHSSLAPTVTDFFLKLAALALEEHLVLNSRWENDRVVAGDGICIGIAVDTDAGLLVPVLRDVPRLSLLELSSRSRDLIERARAGKLPSAEMQGGTFTVTSLGPFGIDAFTPIINYPECAILGIGRIRRCPAVVDEQVVIRDQVALSLTFDHRIADGAPAARFLQALSRRIENVAEGAI